MPTFNKPFAINGQKTPISLEDLGADGTISWEQGFTTPYSKPPEEGGKYVLREEMNQILYLITQKQIDFEKGLNYPVLYDPAVGAKGYPIGARIYAFYNPYNSEFLTDLASQGADAIKCYPIHFINLKNNNTDSPLDIKNLFKTWVVDDGFGFGDLRFSIINSYNQAFTTPPGYLDLGGMDENSGNHVMYKIEDYPRVKDILNANKFPFLKKNTRDPSEFYIEDLRGCFPRLFSNGSKSRDIGRNFDNIQKDAGRKLEGEFMLVKPDGVDSDVAKKNSFSESVKNISCFVTPTIPGRKTCFQAVRHSTIASAKRWGSDHYSDGLYTTSSSVSGEFQNLLGNRLRFDTTEAWGDSNEFRPHNFNVKIYLKI